MVEERLYPSESVPGSGPLLPQNPLPGSGSSGKNAAPQHHWGPRLSDCLKEPHGSNKRNLCSARFRANHARTSAAVFERYRSQSSL